MTDIHSPKEVLNWIKLVIDSCTTTRQLQVADRLLNRCFVNRYLTNIDYTNPVFVEYKKIMHYLVDQYSKLS